MGARIWILGIDLDWAGADRFAIAHLRRDKAAPKMGHPARNLERIFMSNIKKNAR
jgi:hypothetical protein